MFPGELEARPPAILVDAGEAARLLGIGKRKLWAMTASAEVPHVRIGRLVRYSVEALREWVAEKQRAGR